MIWKKFLDRSGNCQSKLAAIFLYCIWSWAWAFKCGQTVFKFFMTQIRIAFFFLLFFRSLLAFADTPEARVTSIYLSQDIINEQLELHMKKSELFKELKIALDPEHGQIFLRGKIQVPTEEMRAVNLDPKLGAFRFQVSIKPEANKDGYLILEFPLAQTFFYPADSKNPKQDRVVVPVQMLSLALASARGYLAALSGDFSSFDRRTQKLEALIKSLDRSIESEKNADAIEDLKTQRDSLRLQLAAVPLERKQLQTVGKGIEHLLGFTGEKEINLNNELEARKNALIFKIQIEKFVPFLKGVELGGIRIRHDKKDGNGENYFVIDVDSRVTKPLPQISKAPPSDRQGLKVAPALILRLNQALFESVAVVDAEKKEISMIQDLDLQLKDDGLHVFGKYKKFFFSVSFETIVDFVTTAPDVFEVRVRELEVGGINIGFLRGFVLEVIKKRLENTLKNICEFKYLGAESDQSRALQVTVEPKNLVAAFPDLHLIDVDIRDREFLLKIGH